MAFKKNEGEKNWDFIKRMHKQNMVVAIIADIMLVGTGIGLIAYAIIPGIKWIGKKLKGR